jgi:acetate---CoA ligase (ADP-forming)
MTMRAVRHCQDFGYAGRLLAVNPKYDKVGPIPCFSSLSAIGEPVDLALILVGRERVASVLEDCSRNHVGAAIVIASDYADSAGAEGKELQRELQLFSVRSGMVIAGPNCLGIVNVADRIPAYGGPISSVIRPGGVAIVSQSGGNASAFIDGAVERHLGLSYVISSGNEACVAFADYLQYLVDDPHTNVICGYLESIGEPARFAEAAMRAARAGKPVVVIKVGGTPEGRKAALAHTGSLSGPDELVNTLFHETGVLRADSIDTALDQCSLLALMPRSRWPTGPRLAVLAIGGGAAGIFADLAVRNGLALPSLPDEIRDVIAASAGPNVTIQNPFDVPGSLLDRHPEVFSAFVESTLAKRGFDALAISLLPQPHLLEAARTAAVVGHRFNKPIVVVPLAGTTMSQEVRELIDGDLPVVMGIDRFVRAYRAAIEYQRSKPRNPFIARRRKSPVANQLPPIAMAVEGQLDSKQTGKLLRAYGLRTVRQGWAKNIDDAVRLAARVGYPVAVKLADVAHKTDVDGVRLDLRTPAEVRKAYVSLRRSAVNRRLSAKPRVNVQRMLRDGLEIYLGVDNRALDYPPAILVGLGGIGVEVERDTRMMFAPLNRVAARGMLESLRGFHRFRAFRGRPPRDTAAVEDAIVRLSHLAADMASKLYELDVNPLIVGYVGHGARVVDALIVCRGNVRAQVM